MREAALRKILVQFMKYCLVGILGAAVTSYGNLGLQQLGLPEYVDPLGLFPIPWSLGFAILVAATSNFLLNRWWTFRQ